MFLFIAHLLINVSQTQSSFQWYDWAISRVNGVETLSVRRHAIHNGMNLGLPMVFFLLHLPQWNDSILLQYIAAGISHLNKIYWISKSLDSSYTISVEYELD